MKTLKKIKNDLNQIAELSNQEIKTSQYIQDTLKDYNPDSIYSVANSYSIIAIFDSKKPGKTIAFRSEIDGLPDTSKANQVRHLCGHDGHSTILLGLAEYLSKRDQYSGKIVLLFQSAEETGEGAINITATDIYKSLGIDMIFGFHNLSDYPTNQIIISKGIFASASSGLLLKFEGLTSHASEPENGINPSQAIASAIMMINKLPQSIEGLGFTLSTIVKIRMGDNHFGINPGIGEIGVTLRAYRQSDLNYILEKTISNCQKIAEWYHLNFSYDILEPFPSTVNNPNVSEALVRLCEENEINYKITEKPFRWSEDFGHYLSVTPGTFFGIGNGTSSKPLHNPEYEFNDNILKSSRELLIKIIEFNRQIIV